MLTVNNKYPNIPIKRPNSRVINFKGAPASYVNQLAKEPFYVKSAHWFSKVGENKLIIINALAKSVLVPLVVIFNPLSKEKKEKKVYYAWKQPIDATISALINLGVNLKLNKFMDKMAEKGELGKLFNTSKNQSVQAIQAATRRLNIFKDTVNLGLSAFTIPLAVLAVNWLYPRFMEKVAPKLQRKPEED